MKKLHLFILKNYLGPLTATFFISLFVLLMQFIWRFVDVIIGKGLDILTLAELLFYATIQVIPMALPLAILLASLMTFGSLGENYELIAIKASGISLLKTMKSLIILTVILSALAFGFSNNVLPWANLKFHTLFYSIQTKTPEMEFKEKEFYNEIETFSIKTERKNPKNGLLYDVMIYDQRDQNNPNSNVTFADSGKIQLAKTDGMMKVTLHNGIRYEDNVKNKKTELNKRDQQQFRTDYFTKQVVLFDVDGLNFERSDETGFTNFNEMKNISQLTNDIDSFQICKKKITSTITAQLKKNTLSSILNATTQSGSHINHIYTSLISQPNNYQNKLALETAIRKAQNKQSYLNQQLREYNTIQNELISHKVELHRKFTLSFACMIFFFIGAPLGAIIRKGGLGMPTVISILFFIAYYMIDTFGVNMAKEGILPVYQGMWLSSLILFFLAFILTYHSVTDSTLLNADTYKSLIKKLFKKQKTHLCQNIDNERSTII